MEAELEIRRLGPEHLDQILAIENVSFSHPWSRESYLYELKQNRLSHYYGCFSGEELLAYAGLWLIIDEGHIANVAVKPEYRGQGLGELLMRRVIADCLFRQIRWMTLEVRESNAAARSLYTKLGFGVAGRRKNYYTLPAEDALIMTLRLAEYQLRARRDALYHHKISVDEAGPGQGADEP